jgi:hypothetical protein
MKHLKLDHLCLVVAIAFGVVSGTALVREAFQPAPHDGAVARAQASDRAQAQTGAALPNRLGSS